MSRHVIIFAIAFVVGGILTLGVRTALHRPYAAPPAAPAPMAPDMPMAPSATSAAAVDAKPVNTICAICGMPVDPAVPTALYKGKVIGFGCKMCPPKFAADPEKYGPLYLQNKVAE